MEEDNTKRTKLDKLKYSVACSFGITALVLWRIFLV